MPDLLEIEIIASDTPARTVVLSGISTTVLFSLLDAGNRIHDWWVGNNQPNNAEIDQIYEWLALARRELMLVQIGDVKATAAATIPTGCLLCDGAIYAKVDYPGLYAVLDSAFLPDADHLQVPDLRSRFLIGSGGGTLVGDTGGEATHTLTIGEIPSHSHTIPDTTTSLAVEPGEVAVLTPIPILTQSTGNTGGDGAHNNIPPYISLRYYIVAE